jgi:hypothetical protein
VRMAVSDSGAVKKSLPALRISTCYFIMDKRNTTKHRERK